MQQTPVIGFPEHQCYAVAKEMVKRLGNRPNRTATDNFLASHISKPVSMQPYQVRQVARFYWRTFAVAPYGDKFKIALI